MRIGLGEIGATDYFGNVLGRDWLNRSLRWAARNSDAVIAVSYFNSTANSDPGVYWPLDESGGEGCPSTASGSTGPRFISRVP